jgi:hypothetical protein
MRCHGAIARVASTSCAEQDDRRLMAPNSTNNASAPFFSASKVQAPDNSASHPGLHARLHFSFDFSAFAQVVILQNRWGRHEFWQRYAAGSRVRRVVDFTHCRNPQSGWQSGLTHKT